MAPADRGRSGREDVTAPAGGTTPAPGAGGADPGAPALDLPSVLQPLEDVQDKLPLGPGKNVVDDLTDFLLGP